ncbi:MAG: hypothetical protein ABSH35_05385 [Isosphaeraceae bacterium]
MSQRTWQGSGSKYTLSWGNQPWTLELEADRPGMRIVDRPEDCVLALDGIAAVGRFDPDALSGKSLVRVERRAQRVEATYAASRWGGLEVRASWSPTSRHNGIDLEVQVSASSVGELRGLETFVFSRIAAPGASTGEPDSIWVQPRDSRSAGFSYDGRMPAADLRRLTTLPLHDSIAPGLSQVAALGPGRESGGRYLEMVHPHDVARRIFWGQGKPDLAITGQLPIRYGLFGHDLEKGVVIRARIRGLWISGRDIAVLPPVALRDFVETPPPLGP